MSISSSNSRQSANGSSSSNYRSTTGNKSSCNASGNASGNASAVARTPCCPHCTNVNKFMNQNLPTDHWLRETADPKSRVVCKELMATECRFCYNHSLGLILFFLGRRPQKVRLVLFDLNLQGFVLT